MQWTIWSMLGIILFWSAFIFGKKLIKHKRTPGERIRSLSYLIFFMSFYALFSSWVKAGTMIYQETWSFQEFITDAWTYFLGVAFMGVVIYIFFGKPYPQKGQDSDDESSR